VSHAAGAATGWLTALDPLVHEMDALSVLRRNAPIAKGTKRPTDRPPYRSLTLDQPHARFVIDLDAVKREASKDSYGWGKIIYWHVLLGEG
jgi:hypothetical protein